MSSQTSYDMDSHSNMSLPSPGSVSMEAPDAKPIIQSVSGPMSKMVALEAKRRVSINYWKMRSIVSVHIVYIENLILNYCVVL